MSDPPHVAITMANSIFIITCTVGNSLVCAVVLRNRDMRYRPQFKLFYIHIAILAEFNVRWITVKACN